MTCSIILLIFSCDDVDALFCWKYNFGFI